MNFPVYQRVITWQRFEIEADSKEEAIAMITSNPTASELGNNGIEVLFEHERVLRTELYDNTDEDAILDPILKIDLEEDYNELK